MCWISNAVGQLSAIIAGLRLLFHVAEQLGALEKKTQVFWFTCFGLVFADSSMCTSANNLELPVLLHSVGNQQKTDQSI